MTQTYPLHWPIGWPRTPYPQRSRFDTSQHRAQNAIVTELTRLGATDIIISTNLELRRDGQPYTKQTRLDDQGVAVYFKYNNAEQCIPCDKWATIAENMQAIAKTVEALRGLDRWGAKEMVDAAFRGFKALPESITMGAGEVRAWHDVLEVSSNASPEVIRAAYRKLAAMYHPDNPSTGNHDKFLEIQKAYKEAMK